MSPPSGDGERSRAHSSWREGCSETSDVLAVARLVRFISNAIGVTANRGGSRFLPYGTAASRTDVDHAAQRRDPQQNTPGQIAHPCHRTTSVALGPPCAFVATLVIESTAINRQKLWAERLARIASRNRASHSIDYVGHSFASRGWSANQKDDSRAPHQGTTESFRASAPLGFEPKRPYGLPAALRGKRTSKPRVCCYRHTRWLSNPSTM